MQCIHDGDGKMGSITGANAVFTLAIAPPAFATQVSPTLFAAPIQLQGFAVDDSFTSEPLASVETLMGVDGVLSAGFVYVPIAMGVTLQADSISNDLFDSWWNAMQVTRDVYLAQGVVTLTTIQKKFALTNGSLTRYKPFADVRKLLQPRQYGITWQSISAAPM
jgi:hypothetical protein